MSNKSSLVPFLTSDEDQNLHVKMVKNSGKPGLNCTEKVLQKGHATISETKARVATCMHGVTVNLCNHNPDLLLILIHVAS